MVALLAVGGFIFGAVKFAGANKNSSSQTAANNPANNQNSSGGGRGSGGRSGRGNFSPPTTGTIQTISGPNLTLTASDNSIKNVTTDSNTRFSKFDNGNRTQISLTDLKVGDQVSVIGSSDSTGTIVARMVFLGQMPTGGFRGGSNGSGGNFQQNDNSQNSTESVGNTQQL